MQRLHTSPLPVTAIAFAAATAAVIVVAIAYGFDTFANAWSSIKSVRLGWLGIGFGAQLLAVPAYAMSYRAVVRMDDGPRLSIPMVLRIVVAGFGPSAVGGGFVLDKQALHSIGRDEDQAKVRVLGLGALEWALLAPAVWVTVAVLLVSGDPKPMPSMLWPWLIGVPLGAVIAIWAAAPPRRRWVEQGDRRWRAMLATVLEGVATLVALGRHWRTHWQAWLGMALYWALDIATFYACTRVIGLSTTLAETILAYGTGYALTRRSMPLGGAGVTEALMTFSLHWVGQPVGPALATVVVYRILNFVLPALPALAVREHVHPLVTGEDPGRGALEGGSG